MHIHGKRMADYTGFVAPRLPKRGVLHPSKRGSEHIYPRQNDVVNAHDIRYFRPLLYSSRLTIFTFASLSLFLSLSFVHRFPFAVLCHRSRSNGWNLIDLRAPRAFLVTSFFVSSRVKSFLGDGTVTVSWDPRVSCEIWQRDNRAIKVTGRNVRNDLKEGALLL